MCECLTVVPSLQMYIFTIHTNIQSSAGWKLPAATQCLAMKKWLIVAESWSGIYYLFTFRVIPSGSRQRINKLNSFGTAVQNTIWIIDSETWEAPAGLCELNKYRKAFLSLCPWYQHWRRKQHNQCHMYLLWPVFKDCSDFWFPLLIPPKCPCSWCIKSNTKKKSPCNCL